MSQPDNDEYKGTRDRYSDSSQYNAMQFFVRQFMDGRNTATLVQIKAVTNVGALAEVGFVDVLPLVNQLDGYGNAVEHGVVHNLPYFRLQGGANAIILDPQVGDIGIAVFADRDISSVKAAKGAANPGSMRRADMADGMYIGGLLNGVPTQFVRFSAAGIEIKSPVRIDLTAPDIKLQAARVVIIATESTVITTPTLTLNGNMSATGTITAPNVVGTTNVTFGGKSGVGHVHGNVQNGPNSTNPPT